MQARNPKRTASVSIDLEIDHPQYGWIPFTASPDDVEPMGRELYEQAVAGDFGPVAEYVAPPVVPPTQEQIDALRQAAYQKEADPIFFKWQRGEATEQQWLDKIADIRARYPDAA
jgi:hypothetical protein